MNLRSLFCPPELVSVRKHERSSRALKADRLLKPVAGLVFQGVLNECTSVCTLRVLWNIAPEDTVIGYIRVTLHISEQSWHQYLEKVSVFIGSRWKALCIWSALSVLSHLRRMSLALSTAGDGALGGVLRQDLAPRSLQLVE